MVPNRQTDAKLYFLFLPSDNETSGLMFLADDTCSACAADGDTSVLFDSEIFEFGLRLNKLFTGTFAAAHMLILTLI